MKNRIKTRENKLKLTTSAFTLIELLAIIVILAIIAVITVPIILNIIENSRKGAATDSAYGYKDSVNKFYIAELQNHNKLKLDGTYTVNSDGSLTPTEDNTFGFGDSEYGDSLDVAVSGTIPSSGSLTYENNVLTSGTLIIGDYTVTYSNGTFTAVKTSVTSNNNQNNNATTQYTVTFNTNGGSEVASQTVPEGGKATRPSDPTQTGYEFDNWYVDNNTFQTLFDFNSTISSNINVYAKWNNNNPYLTTFDGSYTYIGPGAGDEFGTLFDPQWTIYARNDGTINEVCAVFGSSQASTVCIKQIGNGDWNTDFPEDYESEYPYNPSNTSLNGYTKAKLDEMLSKGANQCEVNYDSGYAGCSTVDGLECHISEYGSVVCYAADHHHSCVDDNCSI